MELIINLCLVMMDLYLKNFHFINFKSGISCIILKSLQDNFQDFFRLLKLHVLVLFLSLNNPNYFDMSIRNLFIFIFYTNQYRMYLKDYLLHQEHIY
jgi:hypothetical protein